MTLLQRRLYYIDRRLLAAACMIAMPEVVVAQAEYRPITTFDLYEPLSSSSHPAHPFAAIKLTDQGLCIARYERSREVMHLQRVSRQGTNFSERALALSGSPLASVIDAQCQLHVLIGMQDGTTELQRYTITGDHQSFPLISPAVALASLPDSMLLFSSDGTIRRLKGTVIETLRDVSLPPGSVERRHIVPVDSETIAVVSKHANEVRMFNIRTGRQRVSAIAAPEVKQSEATFRTIIAGAPKGVAFAPPMLYHAAAGDGQGNLFLGVAPQRVSRGMQVVQVDRNGKYVRSLRLLPTVLPRLRSAQNAFGFAPQMDLTITGETFVTASPDGFVAMFERPVTADLSGSPTPAA